MAADTSNTDNSEEENIEDVCALSPLQQGMLFHTLKDFSGGMYITQGMARQDNLDIKSFIKTWQIILERHAILRTSFHWENLEEPLQTTHKKVPLPLDVLDWSEISPREQLAKLRIFQREDREQGFNLTKPALFRITAIQMSRSRWQIINTHHHIILDGWSGGILNTEITEIRQSLQQGRVLSLEKTYPFSNYIRWIEKQDADKVEQFWRQKLSGIVEPTPLPGDKGLTNSPPQNQVKSWAIQLPATTYTALENTALDCNVTLNILLLAAWSLILSYYSGEKSVLFGLLVSGRPPSLKGVDGIVGMFLNTLPFRVEVEASLPLNEWLQKILNQQIELQEYEHSPLMLVQQWSGIPAGSSLFGSMIARKDTQSGKKNTSAQRSDNDKSSQITFQQNYPLLLNFYVKNGLELKLTYDIQRFDTSDIVRIIEQLRNILESMSRDLKQAVGDITLMSQQERARILTEWSHIQYEQSRQVCLHKLFEKQVAATPQKTALHYGVQFQLSYYNLNRQANRLAHHLQIQGITRSQRVAVYGETTPQSVISILAVLKAGAAYLPLDANNKYNLEILEKSDCAAILLHSNDSALFEACEIACIFTDLYLQDSNQDMVKNPDIAIEPHDIACILYKYHEDQQILENFAITHHTTVHRAKSLNAYQSNDDILSVRNQIDTELFQFELFSTLNCGAEAALISPAKTQYAEHLVQALTEVQAGRVIVSPNVLQTILDTDLELEILLPPAMQWFCTGEQLPATLARQFEQTLKSATLYNLYSCIETGNIACQTWQNGIKNISSSFGQALENSRTYILNTKGDLCPTGVMGNIFVAGDSLAENHLETDTAYMMDPFYTKGQDKMFATGDLACWQPDGSIDFKGRKEQRLNNTGIPVNITAIEALLIQQAEVEKAAVVVINKTQKIVAWLLAPQTLNLVELRQAIDKKLPHKSMPTSFVITDTLPLTSKGCIDRNKLANAKQSGITVELEKNCIIEPKSDLEQQILTIWKDILKQEEISTDNNFFELGGHSLSATRVISRLSKELNKSLPFQGLFEAPTIAGLAKWIQANKSQSIGSIARKQQDDGAGNKQRTAPQSFAQQRLWFLSQLASGSALYNTLGTIPLEGSLNISALKQTLTELIRRHESLRTTFTTQDGEPIQVIAPATSVVLDEIDLHKLDIKQRRNKLKLLRKAEATAPFDLLTGPLVRFKLIILGNIRQILLYSMHHIITDGWSSGILRRELHILYQAFRAGKASPLAEQTLQYADFSTWQRDWLQGDILEKQLDYWRDELAELEHLELPTDHSRPANPRYITEKTPVIIPKGIIRKLHLLAREEEATLFMVLLAAFQFVLGQNAGQDDVVIGTPIANRTRAELENIIGFFVNTMAMRTNLSGAPTFRQLLQQVRETCLDGYAHQDIPFERIVEDIAPTRDLNTQPLFQILFVLQNTPDSDALHKKKISADSEQDNVDVLTFYDITLSLKETKFGVDGSLHFNIDLFEPESAKRIVRHFRTLLAYIVRNPEIPLSSLSIISKKERLKLTALAQTKTSDTFKQCIHTLFEQTVRLYPNNTAVVFNDHRLSYDELDRQANSLAQQLIQLGVKPEVCVGSYFERSHLAIISLLAILKAGGVYLPLNPELPTERLISMLDDAAPSVIITQKNLCSSLDDKELSIITLDETLKEVDGFDTPPQIKVSPDNLAYIIFTSGSTGRPKGVMIEHHSLCSLISSQLPIFGLTPESRVLSTIALSFDASLGEIFRTLVAGATLYLARKEQLLPGPDFIQQLQKHHITTTTIVPSTLSALPEDVHLPDLITLSVGGEALPLELARRWSQNVKLINGYGPTETTIGVTLAVDWPIEETPPLGPPLAHVQAYILDKNRLPRPLGVPGELYLGGSGLARGYLKRPDLTNEYFIDNPFSDEVGARLYRTGDRVRWRNDGQLAFLGRVDEQVKIRGYRIEPGEICAILEQHQDIDEAVVIAVSNNEKDPSSGQRLVAYIVLKKDKSEDSKSLVDEWQDASDIAAAKVQDEQIDPRMNFTGWISSYTGEPIPLKEMCQWADDTVQRILQTQPQDVLEIGSGSGLILLRLAPHCKHYIGVDFAAGLLEQTANHLHLIEGSACDIELLHRRADEITDLPGASLDCVVINSVAQYFPNINYFLTVLKNALPLVRHGGTLFLGDLRNYKLMDVFHASIQLSKVAATQPVGSLLQRIQRYAALERELLLDPGLFSQIVDEWPRVSYVQILPKPGFAKNELSNFRYDAILHLDVPPPEQNVNALWLDWNEIESEDKLEYIRQILSPETPQIGIRNVANTRTVEDAVLFAAFQDASTQTVSDLRQQLNNEIDGYEPQSFTDYAEQHSWHCEISWLNSDSRGSYDVLFQHPSIQQDAPFPLPVTKQRNWQDFANDPSCEAKSRNLIPELRDYLSTQLPDYMVPAVYITLDKIPLTTHGKLDRKKLPSPNEQTNQARSANKYIKPSSKKEQILAKIWSDLLNVERVGIRDSFFDLGGDSILSIRMISHAAEEGIELSPRDIYRYQTIEEQLNIANSGNSDEH